MAIALPDTLPVDINVSYSAIYSKSYGILSEVNLNWTNVVSIIKLHIYSDYGNLEIDCSKPTIVLMKLCLNYMLDIVKVALRLLVIG